MAKVMMVLMMVCCARSDERVRVCVSVHDVAMYVRVCMGGVYARVVCDSYARA